MDDTTHSVDKEARMCGWEILSYAMAFIMFVCAAFAASGCDVRGRRTLQMDSTADTQARTHQDFAVNCKGLSPLPLLQCITHRHGSR